MLMTFTGRRSVLAAAAFSVIGSSTGLAASATWSATPTDANWTTAANWSTNAVPGVLTPAAGALSSDIVTFNSPIFNNGVTNIGDASNPILNDNQRQVRSFLFDTGVGAYTFGTLGGNALWLGHSGNVTMTAGVTAAQTFNAPVTVRLPSSTNGTYSLINNASSSAATLYFASLLSGSAASRPLTITLDGANTGNNTIASLTEVGALQVVKNGAGTWVLTGANTFSSQTDVGVTGGVIVNAGTLALQNSAALGTTTAGNVRATGTGTLRLDNISVANGATLDLTGTLQATGNASIASLGVNATATDVNLSTVTSTDTFAVGTTSGPTGGTAASTVHVTGPGTISLNNASAYAGSYSVDAGTLVVGNATALGGVGTASIKFAAASTGVLQLNGVSPTVIGLQTAGTGAAVESLSGSNTLTVNNTAANTYAGVLRDGAGQLSLTKGGNGALSLTGANTFTGNVTVTAGSLLANNASGSATGVGNTLTASGNATVGGSGTIGSNVILTPNARLAPGTGGVGSLHVKSLTLGAATNLDYDITSTASLDQTFVDDADGLTINGGQLNINGGTGVFTTNGVYNLIGFSGAINGAGVSALTLNSLNKSTATNTYTFDTAAGFVTLTVANSGGVISYWDTDSSSTWAVGPWTTAEPNAAGAFASFGGGGTPITADRTVTVSGNKTVGTLAFNSANSFTVTGGSITLDNSGNPAFVTDAAGSHAVNSDIALAAAGNVVTVTGAADTLTLGGALSGSGAISKVGPGTLVLSGNSSYTGGTVLSSGTIAVNSGTSLGDAAGSLDFAGGNLKLLADVTSTRSYVANTNDSNVVIDTNGYTLTHSGAIVQGGIGAGGVVKNGAGTIVLAGTNTYVGDTVVNGGTLSISSNANLGNPATGAAIALGANTTLASTATLALDNAGLNARNIAVNAAGATIDVADTTSLTVGGTITGGAVTKTNTGALVLTNLGNTSALAINAGTVTAGNTAAFGNGGLGTGAITFNGGSLNTAFPVANTWGLVNTINVPAAQTGSMVFPSRVNWTGAVNGAGTLNVEINSTTQRTDFNNNFAGFTGTLNLTGTGALRLLVNGGAYNAAGLAGAHLDLGGSVVINPSNNSGGNTYQIGALSGSSTTANLGVSTQGGNSTWQIGALNTNTTYAGLITGNANVTKVGTGTLTLTAANGYTGVTNINGGTLAINGQFALGGAVYGGATFNGGTLQYTADLPTAANGTGDISQDSLGVAKPVTFNAGGATIDTNGNSVTYANVVGNAGTGGLTKVGVGTLTLNAANTYTGTTTVKAGQLTLGLAAHGSALTVANGADVQGGKLVLDYTGGSSPVATVKTILDAGFPTNFATGQIRGTTLTGNQTLGYGDNGLTEVTIRVTLGGDADLDGDVDFNDFLAFQTNFGSAGTRFDQGNFNYDAATDFNDFLALQTNFGQSVGGDSVAFSDAQVAAVTAFGLNPLNQAVPEPASLALIGLGAAGLMGRRRRSSN